VNDDLDDNYIDDATLSRHTIVATGRVINGGVTVAKRQIKVFADIRQSAVGNIAPGVHTEGAIHGNGVAGYEMWKDGSNVNVDPPDAAFNNNYADSTVALDADGDGVDDRDGIVYQSPAYTPPVIEKEVFIALAKSQGHFHSGDFAPGNNYPNGSFYYSGDAPNIVYVTGNLLFSGDRVVYGVYYVENGTVSMGGNCQLQGIVFCNNNFAAEGGGNKSPNLVGGIIQYGGLTELGGNGNPVEILIDNTFFQKLEQEQPFIDIPVWQQSVSLN
jgi:hypothetical protein